MIAAIQLRVIGWFFTRGYDYLEPTNAIFRPMPDLELWGRRALP